MRPLLTLVVGFMAFFLAGCVQPLPPMPPRPQPPPIPVPVPVPPDPSPVPTPTPTPIPVPVPVPPATPVVPWATVERVTPGLSRADLITLIGYDPGTANDKLQDDGTRIMRWPAFNEAGLPRWLDVQLEGGIVLGRALWKR